jgi:succinate dehydrogenase / fumarate reductase membrane anchor subunit
MFDGFNCYFVDDRQRINLMKASRKWIFQRISALITAPLIVWFLLSLISLSTSDYNSVVIFFSKPLFLSLTVILLIAGFFHAKIGLSEIFEDYIQDEKIKNVANLLSFLLSIIVPSITIILLLYKF